MPDAIQVIVTFEDTEYQGKSWIRGTGKVGGLEYPMYFPRADRDDCQVRAYIRDTARDWYWDDQYESEDYDFDDVYDYDEEEY